jgi:hypothetical protein
MFLIIAQAIAGGYGRQPLIRAVNETQIMPRPGMASSAILGAVHVEQGPHFVDQVDRRALAVIELSR